MSEEFVHAEVKKFYGEGFSKDMKSEKSTPSCLLTRSSKGYLMKLQNQIHDDLKKKNYGCGCTIPTGDISGSHVLDLGSGSGRDCFILSGLVGDSGKVIGIDMLDDALKIANEYKEYHKKIYGLTKDIVDFRKSEIEDLKKANVEDSTIDLVVSNCVVNLAPDKTKVFKEVYRILKEGGELYFSDVFASLRVPKELTSNEKLWSQCISGALYFEDFKKMLKDIGFSGIKIVDAKVVASGLSLEIRNAMKEDNNLAEKVKDLNPLFYSLTVRAFKIPKDKIEPTEEDYNQTVTFLGDKYLDEFIFDNDIEFDKGVETKVSSNTYETLKYSKYSKFFKFSSGKGEHLGRFKTKKLWDIIEVAEKKYTGGNLFTADQPVCCGGEGGGCGGKPCGKKEEVEVIEKEKKICSCDGGCFMSE